MSLRKRDQLLSLIIYLNVIGWYLKNLCPTIFGGDSPELITAGVKLGVAHPTGYPLFTLLLKLSQLLPLGSPAWRANLFNAVIAAVVVLLMFLVVRNYAEKTLPAIIAALLWSHSYTFFSEATISRVYVTNLFFLALIVYSLACRSRVGLTLSVYLAGIGLTNHYFTLIVLPLILVVFWFEKKLSIKVLSLAGCFFLLGLMVYLYLPLRAVTHPTPNWETPYNINFLFNTLTQTSYRYKIARREWGDVVDVMVNLLRSGVRELYLLGPLLAGFGLWGCIRKKRFLVWRILIIIPLINLLMVILYGSKGEFHPLYFLPTFFVGVVYLGTGLGEVFPVLGRRRVEALSVVWVIFSILFVMLNIYKKDYVGRRNNFLFYDYAFNLLNNQESASRFLIRSDYSFPVWYLRNVEERRTDIFVLNYPVNDWYLRELIHYNPEILAIARQSINAREFLRNYLLRFEGEYRLYTAFIPLRKIPERYAVRKTLMLERLESPTLKNNETGIELTGGLKYWRLRITAAKPGYSYPEAERRLRQIYSKCFLELGAHYRKPGNAEMVLYYQRLARVFLNNLVV